MLAIHSLRAGSIYKSKLNDFVFYNLKPVKLAILCQNVVLRKFLVNASMDVICISLFQIYQKPGSLQQ